MIISRAIIPSLILAIMNKKNILELLEMTGLTKDLFKFLRMKRDGELKKP